MYDGSVCVGACHRATRAVSAQGLPTCPANRCVPTPRRGALTPPAKLSRICAKTSQGVFLFSVFGALAQYERALTQERLKAGLAAAQRRGKWGGRPRAISAEQLTAIQAALDGGASKAAICRTFVVKRTTLYDALARAAEPTVLRGTGRA